MTFTRAANARRLEPVRLEDRTAPDATPHPLSAGPFSQNWSNAGLITANDDWSGVPSIVGFRGDNLTTVAGTDPQTLLSDDVGIQDVIADQSNPNTSSAGGVAEFDGLANPVVALQGNGTADAPYLQLYLNTTDVTSVVVSFSARDIDGSDDDAAQQLAVHYRVGSSGTFTNLPAGFINDATTGPNLATLVTPVSVTLPAAAEGQALVQVRIMTANASGTDEWVGIDDITATATSPPPAPTVQSITRASPTPTNAGSVAFTVTFDQPVTGVDASDFAVATGGVSGAGVTGVSPAGPAATYTVTVGTGTGSGTLGLNLVDDDSVVNASPDPLGGTGPGNGNFTGQAYDVDKDAPAVQSVVRVGATPTSAASVDFTVTFTEAVSGVGIGDFALTATGSVGGASVSAVSPAGPAAVYTVTVNTGSGSGTLRLDVADDDTITDAAGNPLGGAGAGNGGFAGAAYAIDRTSPTVTFDDGNGAAAIIVGTTLTYTVRFSEPVAGVDAGDFSNRGTSAVTFGAFTVVGADTYTIQVTPTSAGTLQLQIVGSGHGIADAVGNALAPPLHDDDTITVNPPPPPPNTAPAAADDGPYDATEDTPLVVGAAAGLLANDTDPDGPSPLTVSTTSVVAPASGTLVLSADGSFVYVPAADFFGTVSFTYQMTDGQATATATATIRVAGVNDAPVATNDGPYTATEDGVLVVGAGLGVRANDSDPDGTVPTVLTTPVAGPFHGALTLNTDGSYTYTPHPDYFGADAFTYQITDGALTATATATIVVTPADDPPVAGPDTYTVAEDGTLAVSLATAGLLVNDTDADGDALTVSTTPVAGPAHGSVALNADGTFTYTPDLDFSGTDSFTYQTTDGTTTATAVVTINVTAADDPPTASNDGPYQATEDTPLTVFAALGVLANDRDPDGTSPAVVTAPLADPDHGTLTLNADGSFTYTPAPNYHGPDSFTYQITDGALTASATAAIMVSPVNDAPVAAPDGYTVAEDGTLTVSLVAAGLLANDADIDGDALAAVTTPVSGPVHGTLALNADGTFTYTPAADFHGTDSFTYRVSDGGLGSTAMVTVLVTPVNDDPVAANNSYLVAEDATLTVPAAGGLLANDTDPDGSGTLRVDPAPVSGPAHGTLTLHADGSFVYVPARNSTGPDTFVYAVIDGAVTRTAAVTIAVTAVDDPPAITSDAYTVAEDDTLTVFAAAGQLANDADIDGPAISVSPTPLAGPSHGTMTLNADGSFTYTPAANFAGTDAAVVGVWQAGALVGTSTVVFDVTPVNDAPVAANDSSTVAEDGTLTVPASAGLLANDRDPDGTVPAVLPVPVSGPARGSLTLNADGSFTYTPAPDFAGTDSFTYRITDGALTADAVVTLHVAPVNDPPTARPDAVAVVQGVGLAVVEVLVNDDTGPDAGESLTVTAVTQGASGGLVRVVGRGAAVTYLPAPSFVGTDTFTYTVSDGSGGSATASVTVTVRPGATGIPPVVPPPPALPPAGTPTPPPVAESPASPSPPPPPALVHRSVIVAGAATGGSRVTVYDGQTAEVRFDFFPYGPRFTGGVRVAAGDVNGDGFPEVFTAAGVGGGPHVRGFDGRTGDQLPGPLGSFFAFDPGLRGGVWLAVGDVTGDRVPDVVVGAGPGGGPHVKVFDGATGELVRSFFAYDPALRTGVTVAVGDADADGFADIVTGAGPGAPPHVRVVGGRDLADLASFYAYDPGFIGGVSVAAGDFDGDGTADVATGPGVGGGPHVRTFTGRGESRGDFFAYEPEATNGVWVAAADVTGDGPAEVITGSGPGGRARVRAFTATGGNQGRDLVAFDPAFLGGVDVGGA